MQLNREVIAADGAPKPFAGAPYNQAIRAGNFVFCAGQVGLDPETGALVEGGIEAQTRRVLDNVAAVLAGAGLTPEHVVKTTVFVTDLGDFAAVNAIYADTSPRSASSLDRPGRGAACRRGRLRSRCLRPTDACRLPPRRIRGCGHAN